MKLRRISILVATALLLGSVAVGVARAQGPATVTDFTLKNAANSDVKLSSYAGSKAVVVVFISQSCPFSRLYQDRLSALASTYGGKGVQFLFIDTPINLEASADAEADKLKIKADGTNSLTYLRDDAAQVSTLLGASKTPEAVVLQPAGNGFAVRYRGAIDDNPQMDAYVKQRYVQQVLDNLLAGKPAGMAAQRAAGCLIKKK
ncbi:redoxin domain-containing protein [Hymenobacter sp. J193]|uniref:redoxin domain-containing protein n=1 Tax=Hymenobacter sp. J193 TaxID=2898429 RepID=UPI0021519FCA|nr:redoxin domain-containing protein [Hymenobacter sp. J193]MCR5888876.1 redoxin domain-containing protein [Hymenobacter sp. J193]